MLHKLIYLSGFFTQLHRCWLSVLLVAFSICISDHAMSGTNTGRTEKPIITPGYTAKIQRTSHNVAHITADDMPSAWFGQGYAMAEDRICTLMDQIIKIRGQRARYFGSSHTDSDFVYRHLGLISNAQRDWLTMPADIREMFTAHAAGINAFVTKVGLDGLPSPCRNANWITQVTDIDLLAYSVDFAIRNSSGLLFPFLSNAVPPGSTNSAVPSQSSIQSLNVDGETLGSNGWGLGSDLTQSGNGILLAQPHFPWEGELQSWESHLTVPGKFDIYGATIPGIPNVLVGFNSSVAWTLTVAPSSHHTLYKLKLAPREPTKYLYDGEIREIEATVYTIDVLNSATGELTQQSRTLWRSHYGPMLSVPSTVAFGLTWREGFALTYRDANLDNRSYLKQLLEMSQADGIESFIRAHQSWGSLPFSHTVATSIEGEAWYSDSSPVANLSNETYQAWQQAVSSDFIVSLLWNFGVYTLDGSISRDEWLESPGAVIPGTVPFSEAPQLHRKDFVFNANDSHWLSNPDSPLEGFHPLYGPERSSRSLRTRMNAVALSKPAGSKFSLQDVLQAALSNRSLAGELLRSELVQRCTTTPSIIINSERVDLATACLVLSAWDETFDLDSKGAVLFREFLGEFSRQSLTDSGLLFAQPFDVNNPVSTPYGLASAAGVATDPILVALGNAVKRLEEVDSGLPIDSILRDMQFTPKGEQNIPIQGGLASEGIMNIAGYSSANKSTLLPGINRGIVKNTATGLTNAGEYTVNFGTSFLMAVELTPEGPQCQAILTFSQSEDSESPFFDDQTKLFSNKTWRQCLFSQAQIQADPALRTYQVHALTGDLDGDGNVDRDDIRLLLAARNTVAAQNDKRDLNRDGKITARDAWVLVSLCTQPRCAVL